MLKKHKNQILKKLEKLGMNPLIFEVSEKETSKNVFFSLHLKSKEPLKNRLSFTVLHSIDDYHSFTFTYTKFRQATVQIPHHPGYPLNITDVLAWLNDWISEEVKPYFEELETPDLWQELLQSSALGGEELLDFENRGEFSDDEKVQLRLYITRFRQSIIETHNPSDEQLQQIDDRLNYLSEALDRLNRFDWAGVAASVVISISTALSLDTEKGRILFELFRQAFQGIGGLIGQ